MLNPLVSVILCFYNEEKYIARAINSILNQTYSNFELLLIDDNSTDASYDICRSYNDKRIKLIRKDKNVSKGLAQSRNLGVEVSSGDYVIFQDADDESEKNRIEENIKILLEYNDQERKKLVIGSWLNVYRNGKVNFLKFPEEDYKIKKKITSKIGRNAIAGQVIFLSKELLIKYPYRAKFKFMQDYDQLYRMIEGNKIILRNIPKPLYKYYLYDKGVKNNPEWPKFNYFVRYCRKHRLNNGTEFDSIESFNSYLSTNRIEFYKWKLFETALKFKIKVLG